MKNIGGVVLLAVTFLSSITCAPVNTTKSSQVLWHKRGPSFLVKLYRQLVAGQGDLSQIGAKQIHGIYATVKNPQNTTSSANVVDLVCLMNGTSLPLNQTYLVRLHLSVEAKPGVQQGDCNVVLRDIKSNTEVLSKDIPCDTSNKLVLTVTSCVKNWIMNPTDNAGMRVQISAKNDNFPVSNLPFISKDPSIEPPFYVLYA